MQWGFPKWDGKGIIINAKSETAAEKRTFSRLLEEKRCVIPSTGFYEWQKKDKTKSKDIHDRMPVILYQDELENWLMDKSFIEPTFQRDNIILQRSGR